MEPGKYIFGDGEILANVGRKTIEITMANTGDRPIQIGSHYHYAFVCLSGNRRKCVQDLRE